MNGKEHLSDRILRCELDHFANTQFSQSFNLLLLADITPCKRKKENNKGEKQKEGQKNKHEHTQECYEYVEEGYSHDKENNKYVNEHDKRNDKHRNEYRSENNHKYTAKKNKKHKCMPHKCKEPEFITACNLDVDLNLDNNGRIPSDNNIEESMGSVTDNFIAADISVEQPALLKRSSKFFNLAIESKLDSESPVKGKLKRPFKFVSRSPSPTSNSRFTAPSPKRKTSRLRMSPLKQSSGVKKLLLPLNATHDSYDDDLPLRRRKFSIYLDDTESRRVMHTKTVKLNSFSSTLSEKKNPSCKDRKTSFLFVRPLQTAFEAVGLQKKNYVLHAKKKLPPETPIKHNPSFSFNQSYGAISHDSFNDKGGFRNSSIDGGSKTSLTHSGVPSLPMFQIPSLAYFQEQHLFDWDTKFDENIPKTPTKLWTRSKFLDSVVTAKKPDYVPFTPVLCIPQIPLVSSEGSFNLPSVAGDPTDYTITLSFAEEKEAKKDYVDEHLAQKFGARNIRYIGCGQFSVVYECQFQNEKFAIKRTKKPLLGSSEKKAILREIEAIRVLTSINNDEDVDDSKDNLVFFIDSWCFNNHYYIMTEFCGGTLYTFLEDHKNYKIDEFRVWKMLIEILCGLKFIHLKNYVHLDLKPANIFITFEGNLKIGDFGLCTKLPIREEDFDIEGDRNYIAPELINDKVYTPFADIFSVGLIILEVATNVVLPGNGTPWQKLRSGDLSDAGILSNDNISDISDHKTFSSLMSYTSSQNSIDMQPSSLPGSNSVDHNTLSNALHLPVKLKKSSSMLFNGCHSSSSQLIDNVRQVIPKCAPEFLIANSHNLDRLVSQMLKPNPFERPTATHILEMSECVEIEKRRKAGATIFEGEFGPNDD